MIHERRFYRLADGITIVLSLLICCLLFVSSPLPGLQKKDNTRAAPQFKNRDVKEIWGTISLINKLWAVDKKPEKLRDYFHSEMVAFTGGQRGRIEGRDACVAAWKSFADAATIHAWRETDPKIQIYGNTAIATYYYEITFDLDGKRYEEGGRDLLVLVRENGKWLVVADHYSPYPKN